jgi:branched-chain amino acid transport system permease protein
LLPDIFRPAGAAARRPLLALATFLAIAVPQILKYRHFESFTGGVQGINPSNPMHRFGLPLSSDQWMFLVVLAVAIAIPA